MTTKYLSRKNIVTIHQKLIERFGGSHGIRDEALLESAIGRYQSGYYADNVEEAAALMESLGGNHPFLDGNKRIAVTAPFVFLRANGYKVAIEKKLAFDFISELFLAHEFSFSRLEPWIRANVNRLEESISDTEQESQATNAMDTCLNALQNILSARKEINESIEKQTEELNRINNDFNANKSANPAFLAKALMLLIQRANVVFKKVTLDLLTYSERMDIEGRAFLEGWATSAQWLEEQIPHIKSTDKADELLTLLYTLKEMVIKVRSTIHSLPNSLHSLLSLNDGLPQILNTPIVQFNKLYKQYTGTVAHLKKSINRCSEAHNEFDEQQTLTIHSLDHLLKLLKSE